MTAMVKPTALTEAEGYHFPVGVAVVQAIVREEGGHVLARVQREEDMDRLKGIEALAMQVHGGVQPNRPHGMGGDIRLKTSGWVECVKQDTMERLPISAIDGVTLLVQVIARPTHVWSYEDEAGRHMSGMDWELDRVYLGRADRA